MAIKACKRCGTEIEVRGHRLYCPPCSAENLREKKREDSRRARQLHPEQVAERAKRYREANREKAREWAKRPQYREAKQAWRDEQRFGGLKAAVLERDNNHCKMCGAGEMDGIRNLTVHHIDGNKTRNVMINLITLCRICHPTVHNRWHGASHRSLLTALVRSGLDI